MAKRKQPNSAQIEIEQLFDAAQNIFVTEPELAHKYVSYARKIAQQNRVRFTTLQRRLYCHCCHHYLYPNKNCTVRIDSDDKMLLHICKDCQHVNRFGYKTPL